MTQGIWQNGMYIPPDLVNGFMRDLEGKPVTMGEDNHVVGHITNVRQIGDSLSIDISKSEESKELLERIHSLNNSIEISNHHDDKVDCLTYFHIQTFSIYDDTQSKDE